MLLDEKAMRMGHRVKTISPPASLEAQRKTEYNVIKFLSWYHFNLSTLGTLNTSSTFTALRPLRP